MRIAFLGDSLTEGSPGSSFFALLRDELLPAHELVNLGRAGDTVDALWQRVRGVDLAPVDLAFIWIGVNDAFMAGWHGFLGAPDDDWWEATLACTSGPFDSLVEWALQHAASVACVPPFVADFSGDEPFARRTEDVACMVRSVTLGRAAVVGDRLRLFDLAGALSAARRAGDTPGDDARASSRGTNSRADGPREPVSDDGLDRTVTIDGVHLNDRGARLVADAFAAFVRDRERDRRAP